MEIVIISKTHGVHTVIIDDQDAKIITKYKWYINKFSNTYYVCSSVNKKLKKHTLLMHRLILDVAKGKIIDHINGIGTDNRRCNLRICTIAENNRNSKKHLKSNNKYKGVYKTKNGKRYYSKIQINGKQIRIGTYDQIEEAKNKYNEYAKMYFGEYARIND